MKSFKNFWWEFEGQKLIFSLIFYSFRREAEAYKTEKNKTEIGPADFVQILARAKNSSLTPEIVKSGFRAGGLYPLSRAAVDDSRLLGQRRTSPQSDPGTSVAAIVPQPSTPHSELPAFLEEATSVPYTSTRNNEDILKEIRFLTGRFKENLPDNALDSKFSCQIIEQQLSLLESNLSLSASTRPAENDPTALTIAEILPPPPPNMRAQRKRRYQIPNTNGVMSDGEIIADIENKRKKREEKEGEVRARKQARLEKQQKLAMEPKKPRGRPPKNPKPLPIPSATPLVGENDSSSDEE